MYSSKEYIHIYYIYPNFVVSVNLNLDLNPDSGSDPGKKKFFLYLTK